MFTKLFWVAALNYIPLNRIYSDYKAKRMDGTLILLISYHCDYCENNYTYSNLYNMRSLYIKLEFYRIGHFDLKNLTLG